MLLFVKKRYADQIFDGTKTYEIRTGSRYRNIRAGSILNINGRMRVRVTSVDIHATADTLPIDISDCYPDRSGPFYVFHFQPES